MMKRILMLSAGLLLGAAGTANAAGGWNSGGTVCGGGLFVTCASVSVSWTGNTVTLTAVNAGPGDFKAIALVNLAAYTGTVSLTSGPAGWSVGGPELSDFPAARAGANVAGSGALPPGATEYTWLFTFNGYNAADPNSLDGIMANGQVAMHSISGPNGCSTKFAIRNDGTTYGNDPLDPTCVPIEVVPEPATMVLLATGLIGLAGAQLRRRKNTRV